MSETIVSDNAIVAAHLSWWVLECGRKQGRALAPAGWEGGGQGLFQLATENAKAGNLLRPHQARASTSTVVHIPYFVYTFSECMVDVCTQLLICSRVQFGHSMVNNNNHQHSRTAAQILSDMAMSCLSGHLQMRARPHCYPIR
jgi:hypothetical protein